MGSHLELGGGDVVAVDAMLPAAHGEGAELPADVRHVDVRDAAAVADVLNGVDVVCHQAAVVGAGLLWYAARPRAKKQAAGEPIEGSATRVEAKRGTGTRRRARTAENAEA